MTTTSKTTSSRTTAAGGWRRRLVTTVILVAAVGGLGWLAWFRLTPQPVLPDFPPGSDPEVVELLESARRDVRLWPWSADRWGRLGELLLAHEFDHYALTCLTEAERLDPANGRWSYFAGLVVLGEKPDDCLPYFQRAALRKPEFVTRQRYAQALASQDRLNEAEAVFRQIVQAEPANPFGLYGLGQVALKQGRVRDAVTQLSRLTANPNVRKATYQLLIDAQQQLGDVEAVALAAKRYAELPDDIPWADTYIAELQELKVGAVGRVTRAIRLIADDRTRQAIQLLEETVAKYPMHMQARLLLVKTYTQARDYAGAERQLREALRLEAANSPANILLAQLLEGKGQIDEALEHYRQAVRSKPDSFEAYYSIGKCSLQKGNKKDAEDAFHEVVRLRPDLPQGHLQLATVLAQLGRDPEALQSVNNALRLAPDNAPARKLLEEINARVGKKQ